MSHNTLPTVAELSGEMRERLAKVKYVFTDLDATMLAPGSCVLRDNDGNPAIGHVFEGRLARAESFEVGARIGLAYVASRNLQHRDGCLTGGRGRSPG